MPSFRLVQTDRGLGLADRFSKRRPLVLDFNTPAFKKRLSVAGRKSELVARAVKPEPGLRVLDCTAGLGRDGFLLAHLGCQVTMVERSRVVHALLADALLRSGRDNQLEAATRRIQLVCADAISLLAPGRNRWDVAYADPMFPKKAGSALVRGEMQVLQQFIGPDEDTEALLESALAAGIPRVLLKRPGRSDWKSPRDPAYVIENREIRVEAYRPEPD